MKEKMNEVTENSGKGWLNGIVGVILFSGSLPATKLAVSELNPYFLTTARASIASVLSLLFLILFREKLPQKKYMFSLGIVSIGVVIGFPLLSSLALKYITSAHSIVFLGILPVSTAVFAIIRGGERPHPIFWLFSVLGSVLVIGYAIAQGLSASPVGDLLMIAAVILCGLGYAEGAKLTRTLGGWQVISWALVLSAPIMIPLSIIHMPLNLQNISPGAWTGLGYVSVCSMFLGFIFWYRGLAQGGIAKVGQLQLLQPFFALALAALLLHEKISYGMIAVTMGVILCVAGTKRFAK